MKQQWTTFVIHDPDLVTIDNRPVVSLFFRIFCRCSPFSMRSDSNTVGENVNTCSAVRSILADHASRRAQYKATGLLFPPVDRPFWSRRSRRPLSRSPAELLLFYLLNFVGWCNRPAAGVVTAIQIVANLDRTTLIRSLIKQWSTRFNIESIRNEPRVRLG